VHDISQKNPRSLSRLKKNLDQHRYFASRSTPCASYFCVSVQETQKIRDIIISKNVSPILRGILARTYLDRKLPAERLVRIRAANQEAIGTLPAKHPHIVLALVIAAALQVAKLPVRLGAGPLQSLKQDRPFTATVSLSIDSRCHEQRRQVAADSCGEIRLGVGRRLMPPYENRE